MPECIPFITIDKFVQFDNVNDELYTEVVSEIFGCADQSVDYFTYLGGLNPIDCAAIYFKHAFDNVEKISLHMTWHGTKHLKALKKTRFSQACEEAMNNNVYFSKPKRDEFEDAMIKALKSTKERFRRQQKRSLDQIDEENENIEGNPRPFIKRKQIVSNKSQENENVEENLEENVGNPRPLVKRIQMVLDKNQENTKHKQFNYDNELQEHDEHTSYTEDENTLASDIDMFIDNY
ncbi:PREDICTED: uncharacterized protein LOC105567834 [Vollenhovia emeryi]|uniref:uncharacterized protein LOC105567834 n=1 Tax=Vollenhovia emeryi TaxID=411798 RepID=UPI0005F40A85|nr:PREDICTED: uncharacterized protein LOC105567834 [Vollenhovia emeryi]